MHFLTEAPNFNSGRFRRDEGKVRRGEGQVGGTRKVCVSGWKGKYAVDDSPLGLSITTCAVDEMTRRCGKG